MAHEKSHEMTRDTSIILPAVISAVPRDGIHPIDGSVGCRVSYPITHVIVHWMPNTPPAIPWDGLWDVTHPMGWAIGNPTRPMGYQASNRLSREMVHELSSILWHGPWDGCPLGLSHGTGRIL